MKNMTKDNKDLEVATLAAGCFRCIEGAFGIIKGVERIEVGYTSGTVANPSYEQVCAGTAVHAG